jgi:hypothetical protein
MFSHDSLMVKNRPNTSCPLSYMFVQVSDLIQNICNLFSIQLVKSAYAKSTFNAEMMTYTKSAYDTKHDY